MTSPHCGDAHHPSAANHRRPDPKPDKPIDHVETACPSSSDSPFNQQIVAYTNFIDTRRCTACACKASGGSCHGTLRVYKDDSCSTNEALTMEGVTSEFTLCSNLSMQGVAIGSKELTDLTYVPGKCEPTGASPIGTAYPDESTAVTWCCMPAPIESDPDDGANTK